MWAEIAVATQSLLGLALIASGASKWQFQQEFAGVVGRYIPPGMASVPGLPRLIGLMVVLSEIALGSALLLHLYPSVVAPLTLSLCATFLAAHLFDWFSGRIEDCMCFGRPQASKPATRWELVATSSMLVLAALIVQVESVSPAKSMFSDESAIERGACVIALSATLLTVAIWIRFAETLVIWRRGCAVCERSRAASDNSSLTAEART